MPEKTGMKVTAIILAAGSGTRAGGKIPKQLQMLAGRPVFIHSIERFLQHDPCTQIILVINSAYSDLFQFYVAELSRIRPFDYIIVPGGKSRAESVGNALRAMSQPSDPDELIAVHDAARPLLSIEMIARGFQAAQAYGAAVPAIPLTDSIRHLEAEDSSISVPRSEYVAVQTPQVFAAPLLFKAYNALCTDKIDPGSVTDDASVAERAGYKVTLYAGESENIKITGPYDLQIAEVLFNHRAER